METIMLGVVAVLLVALLTVIRTGINEVIKALSSIDERLARRE